MLAARSGPAHRDVTGSSSDRCAVLRLRSSRAARCSASRCCSPAASSRRRARTSPATLNDVSFEPPPPPTPGPPPAAAGVGPAAAAEAPLQPQIYGGRAIAPQRPPAAAAQRSADGVQLNFEQAEIRDVIKVILGDILGRSYTVDSDVQGQVTLSTSAPMSEGDLLAVLETVLRANGATLVETSPDTFRIMPVDAAIGRSAGRAAGRPADPGPPRLRHHDRAAAQHLGDLGRPVHPAAGGLARGHPDRSRPQRDPVQRHRASSGRTWSRPWPTSTSTGWPASRSACSRCERANVEAIIPELQAIFAPFDPTGAEPSLIRFLPLARLNAVLAIAGDPEQMREVGAWVSRLDRGQAVGTPVLRLQSEARRRRGRRQAAQRGVQRGAGVRRRAEPRPPPAPRWAARQPLGEDGEASPPDGFGEPAAPARRPRERRPSTGPVKVVASKANNSLLIRATPEEYERIEATLARLDTAPWQVLIEATIAEVTLNDTLRYGVQYFLEQGSFAGGFVSAAQRANAPQPARAAASTSCSPRAAATSRIDALSRLTDVKVLSAPSVVVQDNSEAVLTVGEEVPVQTQQQQSLHAADRQHRQQHRVPRHRRHPAGAAADQLQPGGVARDRAGGQPRRQSGDGHRPEPQRRPSPSARSPAGSTSRAARPWCWAA